MKPSKPIFWAELETVEELLVSNTGDVVLQKKKQELQALLDMEEKNKRLVEMRWHKTFLMAKACADTVILRTDGKVEFPKLGRCVSFLWYHSDWNLYDSVITWSWQDSKWNTCLNWTKVHYFLGDKANELSDHLLPPIGSDQWSEELMHLLIHEIQTIAVETAGTVNEVFAQFFWINCCGYFDAHTETWEDVGVCSHIGVTQSSKFWWPATLMVWKDNEITVNNKLSVTHLVPFFNFEKIESNTQ